MRKIRLLRVSLPLLLVLLAVAACGATPTGTLEAALPTAAASATPSAAPNLMPSAEPTSAPTATPSPALTQTTAPTETPAPTQTLEPTATPTFENWAQTIQPDAALLQHLEGLYAQSMGIPADSLKKSVEIHDGIYGQFALVVDAKTGYPLLIAESKEMRWKPATLENVAQQRGWHFGALLNLNRDFHDITLDNFGTGNAYVDWKLVEAKKGEWDFSDPGYNITTAHNAGMEVMANLIWCRNIADWAKEDPDLHAVMVDYITNVMTHFGSEVRTWSVYNEAQRDAGDVFWNKLGMQGIRDAYAVARRVDPDATLLYNDFVDFDGTIPDNRLPIIEKVVAQVKQDGNLDGIALQIIARASSFDASKLRKALDTLSAYGLPIYVEEFSILINGDNTPQNMAEQARVAGEVIQILREYENVVEVIAFPLEDRIANMIYLPDSNSGLWLKTDSGYIPKPIVYEMMKQLAADMPE